MENEQENPQQQQDLSDEEIIRQERKAKQQVVKDMWLGNFPDRDAIHPAAAAAAARMRAQVFTVMAEDWIHEHLLKQDGKTFRLYVIAYSANPKKKDFMAPVADTKMSAIADKAERDQWFPQGDEVDFRVMEAITLDGRVLSGGPFIYGTREEAELALAEILFEGAAIKQSRGREDGTTLDQAVRNWIDNMHDRVEARSARYVTVPDDMTKTRSGLF